ncbi:MAG: type I DNA topoisomerase [Planctomycetes bacterium]|nr:type I DNA topoisomerase [Planctomycetota bacterium]
MAKSRAKSSPSAAKNKGKPSSKAAKSPVATIGGSHLVIVESPTKAKKLQEYLGRGYKVIASSGHIRDLPAKATKGVKQLVPGVDIENQTFEPTYVINPDRKGLVSEIRKLAAGSSDIWFATDLDREGEAIAWHLAALVDVDPKVAKRVVFNAITKQAVLEGFAHPRPIDMDRVNAQQARRILDRILGYPVSQILWKKVAGGLSAGRVQSVATRIVVERDREIRAHIPDESWSVCVRLTDEVAKAAGLAEAWNALAAKVDERGKGATQKEQAQWLADHGGFEADLIEIKGTKFDVSCKSNAPRDLSKEAAGAAEAVGLKQVQAERTPNAAGKGPAAFHVKVSGTLDPKARYKVSSVEGKRETSRPYPPFKTSTLQRAGGAFGLTADRTMRLAQQLYEAGWITYMRTDSLNLAPESIEAARGYLRQNFGDSYVPEKPRFYENKTEGAQEAHEAIRPTDPSRDPSVAQRELPEDQAKVYGLIWRCFMACQTADAEFERTTVLFERSDQPTGAVLRASGRVLVFDGFLRVAPRMADVAPLPKLKSGDQLAPFSIDARQSFSSPKSRYSESSLIEYMEKEGIGRPSTYASIVRTIVDRNYVERRGTSLESTSLGEKVTDFLIEQFDDIIEVGYTREMEKELDDVAQRKMEWHQMLRDFWKKLDIDLKKAALADHTKAEMKPAAFVCPKCGSKTGYRFGKNGDFLSCASYPACNYAAPVDREGRPLLPERVNIRSPENGQPMVMRTGRFGRFITSDLPPRPPKPKARKKSKKALALEASGGATAVAEPKEKPQFIINVDAKGRIKMPSVPPLLTDLDCPKCQTRKLNLRLGKRGPWLGCSGFPRCRGREAWSKVDEAQQKTLEALLTKHEIDNPRPAISTMEGLPVKDGDNVIEFILPGGVQNLAIHPEAEVQPPIARAG